MWRKHCSLFQDHLKYIHNDIVKPFHVGILRNDECFQDIHELEKYLPPPSVKGDILRHIIETFATNNYLRMRFKLLLRMDYPHPCRTSWRKIKRTIVPCLMKIGVTSCPPSISKIIVKGHQPKSGGLQNPNRHPIMKSINQLG